MYYMCIVSNQLVVTNTNCQEYNNSHGDSLLGNKLYIVDLPGLLSNFKEN